MGLLFKLDQDDGVKCNQKNGRDVKKHHCSLWYEENSILAFRSKGLLQLTLAHHSFTVFNKTESKHIWPFHRHSQSTWQKWTTYNAWDWWGRNGVELQQLRIDPLLSESGRLWIDTNDETSARKTCSLNKAWPTAPPIRHEPTCNSASRTGNRHDMAMFTINGLICFLKVGVFQAMIPMREFLAKARTAIRL